MVSRLLEMGLESQLSAKNRVGGVHSYNSRTSYTLWNKKNKKKKTYYFSPVILVKGGFSREMDCLELAATGTTHTLSVPREFISHENKNCKSV